VFFCLREEDKEVFISGTPYCRPGTVLSLRLIEHEVPLDDRISIRGAMRLWMAATGRDYKQD